jgi:hypothetical protein
MPVCPLLYSIDETDKVVKVKEEKKEKEAAPLKSTPTKKKAKGKIDKSLISGPVRPLLSLVHYKLTISRQDHSNMSLIWDTTLKKDSHQ